MKNSLACAGAAAFALLGSTGWAAPAAAKSDVIASGHQTATCLDIKGGSNEAILWSCHGGGNQQFGFRTGSYGQLMVQGKCLSTSGGAGTPLVAVACANTPAQRWINTSEGFLRNEQGWCADVERGGGTGSRVIAWQCNKNGSYAVTNQRWGFARFLTQVDLLAMGPSAMNLAQQAKTAGAGNSLNGAGVVASGGGNVVAAGGLNLLSRGNGVVAAGGGNVIVPAAGVVAAGGLN